MKSLTQTLRYDGCSLDEVHAMLADQAFREQVCADQGVLRHDVSVTGSGKGMQVVIDQVQAAQGIPSFAKRFVGDEIQIVQEEDWSSTTAASLKVTIPGKPGDMRGTVALAEKDDGVTETVQVSIKVGVPLVGGKIEGLVADLLSKALRAENRTGKTWLQTH